MPDFLDHMHALAEATGWKTLSATSSPSVWSVLLDDDLDVNFSALGDSFIVMRGIVCYLPVRLDAQDALCEKALNYQMAVLSTRLSVLALEEKGQSLLPEDTDVEPRLVCFRRFRRHRPCEVFTATVEAFLNDLAWWKRALSPETNAVADSPFARIFNSAAEGTSVLVGADFFPGGRF